MHILLTKHTIRAAKAANSARAAAKQHASGGTTNAAGSLSVQHARRATAVAGAATGDNHASNQ
eukprot:2134631-Alexandrium_andersonii.AAC.1